MFAYDLRTIEGHKKVICNRCKVKKVKKGNSPLKTNGSIEEKHILISEISTLEIY